MGRAHLHPALRALWWFFAGLALSFDLLSTSIKEDKVRCTNTENFSNCFGMRCFQLLLFCGVFGPFILGGSYNINNLMWGHRCQDILIQWQYFGSKWLEGDHFRSELNLTTVWLEMTSGSRWVWPLCGWREITLGARWVWPLCGWREIASGARWVWPLCGWREITSGARWVWPLCRWREITSGVSWIWLLSGCLGSTSFGMSTGVLCGRLSLSKNFSAVGLPSLSYNWMNGAGIETEVARILSQHIFCLRCTSL